MAKRAEFFRFQNWENITAHNIMPMKKIGSTNNCNDLEKAFKEATNLFISNIVPDSQIDKKPLRACRHIKR